MKIKKEFIDLIYNGEKKYEFRNNGYRAGVYKIKDKYFELKQYCNYYEYKIKKEVCLDEDNENKYSFCDCKISEQEYNWIKNNVDYFIDSDGETYIVVYKWVEIELKEFEEVE